MIVNTHQSMDEMSALSPSENGLYDHPVTGPVDMPAAEQAVYDLLVALGEDPSREGLIDTPGRVARAMSQIMAGRYESAEVVLDRRFEQATDEPIILKGIEFHSVCEHHLLPFFGQAHVAYLPGKGEVVGLSKLARLVELYAKRPQIQEQMTNQIADALEEHLEAAGVAVVIEAQHMCMKMRGVGKQCATMQTYALRGEFKTNAERRAEIFGMMK